MKKLLCLFCIMILGVGGCETANTTDMSEIKQILKDKNDKLKCWGHIESCTYGYFSVDKDTTIDGFNNDYEEDLNDLGIDSETLYHYMKKQAKKAHKKVMSNKKTSHVPKLTEKETQEAISEAHDNDIDKYGRSAIQDNCKQWVDVVLKSPSTAKYPGSFFHPDKDWAYDESNGIITVSSYVDSENSFGAKIRSYFTVKMEIKNDVAECTYLSLDGTVFKNVYQ